MSANDPGQTPLQSVGAWTTNISVPKIVLAIGAHPDDIEFGCGGTLAKWSSAGSIVHHLVLTDGSKGTWNPDADITALVAQRQIEQSNAARALGATGSVIFLGHTDGELVHSPAVVEQICLHIRQLKPDVVLTHDPWKRYRLHPDHRNAGLNSCDAIVAARDPHFLRHQILELGAQHHRPDALLLWEADEANHAEDVSAFVDVKLDALLKHASQFESTMKATDDSGIKKFRERIQERMTELGVPYSFDAAEVFHYMNRL